MLNLTWFMIVELILGFNQKEEWNQFLCLCHHLRNGLINGLRKKARLKKIYTTTILHPETG